MLEHFKYNQYETRFLVNGFRFGFDLGYRGQSTNIQRNSPNLKLRVGSTVVLWNKIMKEVKLKRFAGPFEKPPFDEYIQSPVGLVPKDGGKDTRLIFHLSYPRNGDSINSGTPKKWCKVKYPDFAEAVRKCLDIGDFCVIAKSDMKSAFRNLGILRKHWKFLILMAQSPLDGKWYYFVDKALPFGAAISCSHFQRFSNCVAFLAGKLIAQRQKARFVNNGLKEKESPVNYLDDFLFAAMMQALGDQQVEIFLELCNEINFPVSIEKTFWSTTVLSFLGLLIDTVKKIIAIPTEKVTRAKELILEIVNKRKTTVQRMQKLCGFLNFLCRCIVPGRAFTRRLYATYSPVMKPYHHINVNKETKQDLFTWLEFLETPDVYC